MTSTSNPPIALEISLIIVFVVLFALSIYWLLFRKGRPIVPHPTQPPVVAQPPDLDAFEDEWEASAPYPEYALRAVQPAPHRTRPAGMAAMHDLDCQNDWERWDEPPASPLWLGSANDALDRAHSREHTHDARGPVEEVASPASSASPATSSPAAQVRCPRCLSTRIDTRNLARKAGSTIGSVAGATGAMAAALAGAETGAVIGSFIGPAGTVFGGLAGAVIAGLVGSAAGCAAGSVVGEAIDQSVLDNHVCLACWHSFSATHD